MSDEFLFCLSRSLFQFTSSPRGFPITSHWPHLPILVISPYLLNNIGEIACEIGSGLNVLISKCAVLFLCSSIALALYFCNNCHADTIHYFLLASFIKLIKSSRMRVTFLALLGLSAINVSAGEESDGDNWNRYYKPSNSWSKPSGGWNSKVSIYTLKMSSFFI